MLRSPFSQFGMREAYAFFETRGLPLKVEARKRAFPQSEKAADVVRMLEQYMRLGKVEVRLRTPVEKLIAEDGRIAALIAGGQEYTADSYIWRPVASLIRRRARRATGFAGSHRSATASIADTHHRPLERSRRVGEETLRHGAQGCEDTLFCEGERAFVLRGDVLCTHFGLSGPLILNNAGKVADLLEAGVVTAQIDTYPDLDLGILEKHITGIFDANKNKTFEESSLRTSLPWGRARSCWRLRRAFDPGQKCTASPRKCERPSSLLKALPVTITGLMGFDRAVVADGGLSLTDIDEKTMRARAHANLFVTETCSTLRALPADIPCSLPGQAATSPGVTYSAHVLRLHTPGVATPLSIPASRPTLRVALKSIRRESAAITLEHTARSALCIQNNAQSRSARSEREAEIKRMSRQRNWI